MNSSYVILPFLSIGFILFTLVRLKRINYLANSFFQYSICAFCILLFLLIQMYTYVGLFVVLLIIVELIRRLLATRYFLYNIDDQLLIQLQDQIVKYKAEHNYLAESVCLAKNQITFRKNKKEHIRILMKEINETIKTNSRVTLRDYIWIAVVFLVEVVAVYFILNNLFL